MDSPQTDRPLAQLSSIKAQLDLVLLALEALVGIGSEAILAAAHELQLNSLLPDRVSLWRLRQSSPLRQGQGRKKLDVDEARALVLITCRLAAAHHGLIRQAVARLEQLTEQGKPPHRAAVLGDYLDSFSNTYLERMGDDPALPAAKTPEPKELAQLALQLLIDLLFYSSPGGVRRLWLSLVDRAG